MTNDLPFNHVEKMRMKNDKNLFNAYLCFCYFSQSNHYTDTVKFLHPQEKKYNSGLKFEKRIKSYLLGRYAAKCSVSVFAGEKNLENILIQRGVFNQPVVKYYHKENIQVSITHCDDFGAAVAFSEDCPVGIDIEKVDASKIEFLEVQATEAEKCLIKTIPFSYEASLTLLWSVKESLSKVLKTGLAAPLNIYEISKVENKNDYTISYFNNFSQYYTVSFELGKYIFSLTCPVKTELDTDITALKENLSFVRIFSLYKNINNIGGIS